MKWLVELFQYYQGGNRLDFEACLDTPVYMYNLQSRYVLKEHINKKRFLTSEFNAYVRFKYNDYSNDTV